MSKRFNSLMAIAFAALLAWPTGASAQKKLPVALRSSRVAKQDPKAAEQANKKVATVKTLAMPLVNKSATKAVGARVNKGKAPVFLRKQSATPVPFAPQSPRLALGGTDFLSELIYYSGMGEEDPNQFVKFNTADFSQSSTFAENTGYFASGVGLIDGVLYGANLDTSWASWGYIFTDLYQIDIETGEELNYDYTSDGSLAAACDVAVTPDGLTYGFFYNADVSAVDFALVDYSTRSRTVIAPNVEKFDYVILGITKDGAIYGVDTNMDLYKIDAATGAYTKVGATGVTGITNADGGYYYQTGEIDQRTGTFYWQSVDQAANCVVYAIDLETGAATKAFTYPGIAEYVALVNAPYVEPTKAPNKPTDFVVSFDGLHSYLHFQAPSTTASGEDLPEKQALGYVVESNGEIITRGTCTAGETKSTVIELPDGFQNVTVYCENAWGQSRKAAASVWVGRDVPVAVAEVKFVYDEETQTATVTWDAVKDGAHEGDVLDVVYDVYRNGAEKTLVAENINATEFSEKLEVEKLSAYSYAVVAKNKAGEAPEAVSNVIVLGDALEVPFTVDFANASDMALFTIIDANGDETTWKYDETNKMAVCGYNTAAAMDDWLIAPPVYLEAGKAYNVIVGAKIRSTTYPERIEVKLGNGTAVEDMTIPVIAPTDLNNAEEPVELVGEGISVEESGTYYVGIHGISDANMWNLYVTSVAVEAGPSAGCPAKIEDLAVEADKTGALKANVTFTAPAKSMDGSDLTANLEKIELYRDNAVINTFEDIAPGAAISYVDETDLENGSHIYQVVPYNAEGNGPKSEKVVAFIGVDAPAEIADFACEDKLTSIAMSWTPVGTVGANGGVVNPEEVEYQIWTVVESFFGLSLGQQVASVKGADEYNLDYNTLEGEQTYAYFAIIAANDGGETIGNLDGVHVGAPYQLPVIDPIGQDGLLYMFPWDASDYDAISAALNENASNGDGAAIAATSTEAEQIVMFAVGKVDVSSAVNPVMTVDVSGMVGGAVKLLAQLPDGSVFEGEDIAITETGYKTYSFDLSQFTSEAFVIPYVVTSFPEAGTVYFDNFQITDVLEYNLEVAMSAPKSVSAGQEAPITINVKNQGEKEAKGYTVKLTADDKAIELDQTDFPTIFSGGEEEFTATFAPTIFDKGGDVVLKAEVVYDLDLNDKNNVAESTIKVNMPSVAGPENVTLNGNEVSWIAPSGSVAEKTESFEDFDLYSVGGVSYGNPAGKLNDWSVYDEDGAMYTYGFSNGSSLLQYENAGEAMAWQVFDGSEFFSDGTLARTGNRLLMSANAAQMDDNTSGVPDTKDWLISPVLPGVAQTVKFFVRQASTIDASSASYYGLEGYELYYSTTDDNISSFIKVAEGHVESAEWAEVTFDIPEGAKYFAIRHVAHDVFMLYLDDVTYTSGAGDIVGYNIYVDGEQVGSVEGTVLSFIINGLSGEHQVAVTAVYSNGVESLPVYVSSSAKGLNDVTAIEAIMAGGQPVDIYTTNGVLVRQQARSIEGLKAGVYVVNGLKVMVK